MPVNTQVKLLRVLQEKSIQRLGGRDGLRIDARVLAATHRDLEAAMREKQFREDPFASCRVNLTCARTFRQKAHRHDSEFPAP
jgi:transcriptional regulator with GAF, ATPase, and Fis domain